MPCSAAPPYLRARESGVGQMVSKPLQFERLAALVAGILAPGHSRASSRDEPGPPADPL